MNHSCPEKKLRDSFSYFWEEFEGQISIGRFKKHSTSRVHRKSLSSVLFAAAQRKVNLSRWVLAKSGSLSYDLLLHSCSLHTLPFISSHLNDRVLPATGIPCVQTCPQNNRSLPSKHEQWGNSQKLIPGFQIYENGQHCQTVFRNCIAFLHWQCNLKLILK